MYYVCCVCVCLHVFGRGDAGECRANITNSWPLPRSSSIFDKRSVRNSSMFCVFFFFYYSEEPRQQQYRDVKITFGWLFCSLFRTMSSHGGRNPQQRACPEANREPRGPTFYFLFLVNSIVWRVRSFVHHLSPSYSINLNISIAEVRVGAVI